MLLETEIPQDVWSVCLLLEDVSLTRPEGREVSARTVQELAAYQGGFVLQTILTRVLMEVHLERDMTEEYVKKVLGVYDMSYQALGTLTGSKVVVERCLNVLAKEERQMARIIYKRLLENALKVARSFKDGVEEHGPLIKPLVVGPLECLANFVRGSRIFRAGMRDILEETTISDSLGFFLSADFVEKVIQEDATLIQHFLTSLASSLAFYPDSQLWAIDKGLLEMLAAIFESSPLQQLWQGARSSDFPVARCTAILLLLLETEVTTEELRAHNALTTFRPYKWKMELAYPGLEAWSYFETRLEGRPRGEDCKQGASEIALVKPQNPLPGRTSDKFEFVAEGIEGADLNEKLAG
ncbi:hypothetical protein KFL_000220320 [Klebsormidium nitens]|uniref:Uncharacterized protein n=1 Tax=Klebsormidium nitens TaxID=105231 RepID=A0A1Y1HPU5_KLENI|nr:hypothetical protein KFL_000220320 [Klebsormidium nitens]|eukprot:GAQ79001.1 hypothetical protein KFL_000220320 [Klebsormidium nitens]